MGWPCWIISNLRVSGFSAHVVPRWITPPPPDAVSSSPIPVQRRPGPDGGGSTMYKVWSCHRPGSRFGVSYIPPESLPCPARGGAQSAYGGWCTPYGNNSSLSELFVGGFVCEDYNFWTSGDLSSHAWGEIHPAVLDTQDVSIPTYK